MKWVVRLDGGDREVEVEPVSGGFAVTLDGHTQMVDLVRLDGTLASVLVRPGGASYEIAYQHETRTGWRLTVGEREIQLDVLAPIEAIAARTGGGGAGAARIEAPIPGRVVAVKVAPGDEVRPGQPVVVLEAMKMENELVAERSGTVQEVFAAAGDVVDAGFVLVVIA